MKSDDRTISGPVFGSFIWLWLPSTAGAVVGFLILGAVFGLDYGYLAADLVGLVVGMALVDFGVRLWFTVSVSPEGVQLSSGPFRGPVIPWDNVFAMKRVRWWSGVVELMQPIRMGRLTRKSLTISYLDPHWLERGPATAIGEHIERRQDGRTTP